MNERIWELAKKAGINLTPAQFSGVLEDEVDEFTLEDFAKLLIRECVEVMYDNAIERKVPRHKSSTHVLCNSSARTFWS